MWRLLRCSNPGKLSIPWWQSRHLFFCFISSVIYVWIIWRSFCVVPVLPLNCNWPRLQGGWDLWICHIQMCAETGSVFVSQGKLHENRVKVMQCKCYRKRQRQYLNISYQSPLMNSTSYYIFYMTYASYHANHAALFFITSLLHSQGSRGFPGFPGANGEKGARVRHTHTHARTHALNTHNAPYSNTKDIDFYKEIKLQRHWRQ